MKTISKNEYALKKQKKNEHNFVNKQFQKKYLIFFGIGHIGNERKVGNCSLIFEKDTCIAAWK